MPIIDHRGFRKKLSSIHSISLDASLASDLKWEIDPNVAPHILWHLDFNFERLDEPSLASYKLATQIFGEKIEACALPSTLGVMLYKGGIPPFPIEEFSDYLHLIAASLPESITPFALFDCFGDPQFFSKEIFPYIHLGFREGPVGAIAWQDQLRPCYYESALGVLLPARKKMERFDPALMQFLPCQMIAEPYFFEEWDGLDSVIIFPHLISTKGERMVEGFKAAGGKVIASKVLDHIK